MTGVESCQELAGRVAARVGNIWFRRTTLRERVKAIASRTQASISPPDALAGSIVVCSWWTACSVWSRLSVSFASQAGCQSHAGPLGSCTIPETGRTLDTIRRNYRFNLPTSNLDRTIPNLCRLISAIARKRSELRNRAIFRRCRSGSLAITWVSGDGHLLAKRCVFRGIFHHTTEPKIKAMLGRL